MDVERLLSPGMHYRHYALRAKLIVVEGGDLEAEVKKVRELAEEHSRRV